MFDVIIDSLLDSLKVLAVLVVVNILIAFVESRLTNTLEKSKKYSPLVGSLLALIPQCGFSVVATDLYTKKHISIGTIIAIYIATSDEAIPVLLSYPSKFIELLILLLLKVVIAIIIGYIVDLIFYKSRELVHNHETECEHHEEVHIGCCKHTIEDENKIHRYLIHPLIHSLKLFVYVLIINIIFGILYFFFENEITEFLTTNKYLSPIFASLVGLIPNCASSLLLSELYATDKILFSSLLSGLVANAGLGLTILIKKKENIKDTLIIVSILLTVSIISGYILLLLGY